MFALIAEIVAPLTLRAATGDLGILMAAVNGLHTSERRKAALRRHIWRPRRFRALLDRFAGRVPVPATRAALLAGDVTADAPLVGLRSQSEIDARIEALRADADDGPISKVEMDGFDALLGVQEALPYALAQLTDLAVDLPAISDAVTRLDARAEALADRGVDVETLQFEASYGRTSLEYYDGFVFGFYAKNRPDLPPLASGGRYDALTRRLGDGGEIPAVGAVLRPGLMALGGRGMTVKLGVPSKGRLMEKTFDWFARRGVTLTRTGSDREYSGEVEGVSGVGLVLLSAGEIPRELAAGRIHLGVTGTDLIREKLPLWDQQVEPLAETGIWSCQSDSGGARSMG